MTRFSDFVTDKPPVEPFLPLTHTCDGFAFRGILESEEIKTSPCGVFIGETLVYLFYGRPAFRVSQNSEPVGSVAFMPVCFVMKQNTAVLPKRVAPFDTGAFGKGLFESDRHPQMKLEDFFLAVHYDTPARVVKAFYGTNEAYLAGKPKMMNIPPLEMEVNSYYGLISNNGKTKSDDRRSTVEMQFDQAVKIMPGEVLLVVLPNIFFQDPKVRETIVKKWQAKVRGYNTYQGSPSEYHSQIFAFVGGYLKKNKCL